MIGNLGTTSRVRSPARGNGGLASIRGGRRDRGDRSSLMNIGRRVDYALRALSYIAAQGPDRVVSRTEIETSQAVPPHYLSKILRMLAGSGLLESVSGARGGFRLGRAAGDVSVRDVYESIEGRLCLIECVRQGSEFCCFAEVCTQIDVWRGAQRVLMEYLQSVSIAALADREGLVRRLGERAAAAAS